MRGLKRDHSAGVIMRGHARGSRKGSGPWLASRASGGGGVRASLCEQAVDAGGCIGGCGNASPTGGRASFGGSVPGRLDGMAGAGASWTLGATLSSAVDVPDAGGDQDAGEDDECGG